MKKRGFILVFAVFTAFSLWAQPPQAFNYQAVVRNSSGEIIANQLVGVRINIRNITVAGTIIYQESHSQSTNAFGLLNLKVGSGTPSIGIFSTIDWRNNAKFIEVLVDVTGGTNYVTMGSTELLSVPYAQFSKNSSDSYLSKSGSNIYYNDGNLGLGTSSPNRKLEIFGNDAESGMRVAWGSSYPSVYGDLLYNTSEGFKLNSNAGGGGWADISFQTNGTTKMFIESAGNVGIGTTTPDNRLVIKSAGAGDVFKILSNLDSPLVKFRHTGNNSGALYLYDGMGVNTVFLYGDGNSHIISGSLGLGTTSPSSAKLQIEGTTTYEGIIRLNNTGTNGASFFMGSTNSDWGGGTNQNLFVMGHGAPASAAIDLSINSSGYLGIGTPLPSAGLHLKGSDYPASFMYLESASGNDAGFRLYEGTTAKWHIFNNSALGGLQIYNTASQTVLFANQSGNVGIGTTSPASRLDVRGNVTIRDNSTGTIAVELGTGLDYAEGFNVTDKTDIEPGTVLCIDPENPGKLMISSGAYDSKVAGIVAGANNLGSGISLGTGTHDFNVALAGRVYCNVDASEQSIKVGDLLTTSSLPGFAMKVENKEKAQGAILGKAMESLAKGQKGQILVLVTLQ